MVIFDDRRLSDDGSLEFKEYSMYLDYAAIMELLDGINHAHYHLRLMEKKGETRTPLYESFVRMLYDYRTELKRRLKYVSSGALTVIREYDKIKIPDVKKEIDTLERLER